MQKMGVTVKESTETRVAVERKTRESEIKAAVSLGKRKEARIGTELQFFNHMVETLGWRACINIDLAVKTTNFRLTHVIAEDSGLVLGRALKELLEKRMKKGVNGSGASIACIDEALALACVSVEGRANAFIDKQKKELNLKKAEDTLGADLIAFIEGLSQGMQATIHVMVLSGDDPHHLWESIFRALGEALGKVFEENSFRIGSTAGVKGTLE